MLKKSENVTGVDTRSFVFLFFGGFKVAFLKQGIVLWYTLFVPKSFFHGQFHSFLREN